MRFVLVIFMLLFGFGVFSQDSSNEVTEKWVKAQLEVRKPWSSSQNRTKVREVDTAFIEYVSKYDFKSVEPLVASYLRNVLFEDDRVNDPTNIRNSLDILINKFGDKNYFIDYSNLLIGYKISSNPFVLKKIIEGLTKCLIVSQDKIFKNFDTYYKIISIFLNDKQKYGSDYVIPEFIAFLREYIKLVGEKKIEDTIRKKVISMVEDMGLSDKKRSDFQRYQGGEELKQEYFFYNEEAFNKK